MPELGFFGKIPAKGDFVRHKVDGAARAFEQWVQESNDALRGADGKMPEQVIRAVHSAAGSTDSVLAVIAPSRDQVGRQYPLCIFALAPATQVSSGLSTMPQAWSRFFEAAVALTARTDAMDLDQLKAAVDALPTPGTGEPQLAAELAEKVLAEPLVAEFIGRLFSSSAHALYAFSTFLTAAQDSATSDPSKAALMLDCPLGVDVDLFVWLELLRRSYGFPSVPPSYFWTEDPSPRLLTSLGASPLAILSLFGNPELEHPRLWPLRTDREAALDAAQKSLGGDLAGFEGWTLGGLLDALARRASSGTMR